MKKGILIPAILVIATHFSASAPYSSDPSTPDLKWEKKAGAMKIPKGKKGFQCLCLRSKKRQPDNKYQSNPGSNRCLFLRRRGSGYI